MGDLSLDAYPDQEPTREVNTPLSLEACRVEGILPSELLYRPLNSFAKPGLPQEIQKLHFDFYETKRVESLQNVRNIKQKLKRQRALSDSKSISFILSKSEQFEQSLQASKAKQIALISKAAVHEAIHAKKLSKLKSDEEAKAELEREKRRVETLRIRREAEEKRRIEMEKLKKEKEDEERRDKIRNMQMERDNDVMKRIQEREDKLQHERLAQRSHNDRVREEIYARLSERQLEQESWKTARELKNSKREAEREQKLEQQKKEFREKLKEKAKMRAMNRAQARQQADSFQKKVEIHSANDGVSAE